MELMRLVQTLWSGGHSLHDYSYGWLTPEHHLMAWALSAMGLKRFYHTLCLYTDCQGARVLIDQLQLPYDEVVADYDGLTCLPQHWAYAKIKTYARQQEPFLHVDSDIFVSKALPEEMTSASLAAQNLEHGTAYYRRMADEVLHIPDLQLSEMLVEGLKKDAVPSYNMGLFGGTNLEFIHKYCATAFRFYEENRPDGRVPNCNVVTEQMFFAIMAQAEKKEVTCLLPGSWQDNGYLKEDFCDLRRFDQQAFFHILGGHKRHEDVCRWLELTLLRLYPDVYERIIRLFPEHHPLLTGRSMEQKDNAPLRQLLRVEQHIAASLPISYTNCLDGDCTVTRNPLVKGLTEKGAGYETQVPSLGVLPVRDVNVSDLGRNVWVLLKQPCTVSELADALASCFAGELQADREKQEELITAELCYLIYHGVVLLASPLSPLSVS